MEEGFSGLFQEGFITLSVLNFTLKQHLPRKINTTTRDGEPGFDCFIWQPHLAFTSPFIAGKHSLICTTIPDPWAVFT